MSERWKEIPRLRGYFASSAGRVKRTGWFKNKKQIYLKSRADRNGYLSIIIRRSPRQVSRLVLMAFDRMPKKREEAAHLDGNRTNNHVENLKWCTHKENMSHKRIHRTENWGEKCKFSKLTFKQVCKIRALFKGESSDSVAKLFKVNRSTINRIRNMTTWNHDVPKTQA